MPFVLHQTSGFLPFMRHAGLEYGETFFSMDGDRVVLSWERRILVWLAGGLLAAWALSLLTGSTVNVPDVPSLNVRLYRAFGVAAVGAVFFAAWRRPLTTLGFFLVLWPLTANWTDQLDYWMRCWFQTREWSLTPQIGEGPLALALAVGLTLSPRGALAANDQTASLSSSAAPSPAWNWAAIFRVAFWFYAFTILGSVLVGMAWSFSLSASWPAINVFHNFRNFAFACSPYFPEGDVAPLVAGLRNVAPVLFGLALLRLSTPDATERRRLLGCLVGGAVLVGVSVILHGFYNRLFFLPAGSLYNGLLTHPHFTGPVVVCGLFLVAHCLRGQTWRRVVPLLAVWLLLLWALLLTGCRNAWLFLPVGFAGAALLAGGARRWGTAALAAILLLSAAALPWIMPKTQPDHFFNRRLSGVWQHAETGDYRKVLGERLHIYEFSWRLFGAYPVAGVGCGLFHQLTRSETAFADRWHGPRNIFHAHNLPLHRLAESGLPGLAACLAALFLLPALAAWRERKGKAGSLFGIVLLMSLMNLLDCALLFCGAMQFVAALTACGVWIAAGEHGGEPGNA